MKIKKLSIKNFKGILNAEINLGDLTIITGKNSSGKSSLIQSIKYITQWLNRVETTRGLNEFVAPGLNVYHPDFITENLKYDAIKNSKAREGVSLGIQFHSDSRSSFDPISGQIYELKLNLEKASQIGEIVRLKNLSVNSEWLDNSEEDEIFNVIYGDETDKNLNELRRKYINSYSLGIFDPNLSRKFAQDNFLGDKFTGKDDSLHSLWMDESIFKDYIDPIQKIIYTEIGDSKSEEALILNNKGERLIFRKSPFEIIQSEGYQNFYINYFFDYLQQSINKESKDRNSKNQIKFDFERSENFYEDLFKLISNIFKQGFAKELSNYFNHDVVPSFSKKDIEETAFSASSSQQIEDKFIKGLSPDYLVAIKKNLPKKVYEDFKKLTTLINNTNNFLDKADKHAELRIVSAQFILMFIIFFNSLLKSRKAIDLNKYIDEIVSDNDMLTIEGASKSVLVKPIEAIIELQNILASTSQEMGVSSYEKSFLQFSIENDLGICNCSVEDFNNINNPDGRSLEPNEIVLSCKDNPITQHVYKLTTEEEQKTLIPNEFTLHPKANFRGIKYVSSIDYNLKIFLMNKTIIKNLKDSRGTVDNRLKFFGSLLKDEIKKADYGRHASSFVTSKKNLEMIRERILDIERREKNYEAKLQDLEEEVSIVSQNFGILKRNLSNELSNEDRNMMNKELTDLDLRGNSLSKHMRRAQKDLEVVRSEKQKLLKEKVNLEKKVSLQSEKVDSKNLNKLASFMDTLYVEQNNDSNNVKSFLISELARDIKYLNNGRNPSLKESPGAFNENLTVGKYGGLLPNLMFTSSDELVEPFLYPSVKTSPPFDRSYEELDWHFLGYSDFLDAFNSWVSYLEMEISQVESVMDGPNPLLKVQGKDDNTRNIFEVGSGVSQVLPVIAICLLANPDEVVCIEEPESNLHPSAQAYLADFLLSMAASGRQIIIETHSPNIIDRVRLRKAHQKSWKKLKDKEWISSSLSVDKYSGVVNVKGFEEPEINIIFAEQSSEGDSQYREAVLDSNGDIIFDGSSEELWPKGFFDNTQEELSNILKARIFSEEE